MNADSLQAYNSSNKKYFEVSASGMKFGTDLGSTVATTSNVASEVNATRSWYATCSTAAGTAAKVATISPTTTAFTTSILKAGTLVNVKFTVTNTAAVADLTLNVNSTGAKHIKTLRYGVINNIAGTGYLAANTTYQFTYDGTYWVMQENYNSDTYDRKRISNGVIVAENITQYCIAGRSAEPNVTGHKKLVAGLDIDLTFPICYLNQANASEQSYAVASGETTTNFYTAYPSVNLQNTKGSWTGTNRAVCYIKGTLTGRTLKVHSDIFTTTVPTSDDGFAYVPIGVMYSTTQISFDCDNTVYAFRNGSFHKIDTGSDYVTQIGENGIWITPPKLKPTDTSTGAGATGTKIDGDGMDIYQKGISVAHYGDYARVGIDGEANTTISPNQVTISASGNINALRITPNGNTQTVHHSITKQHLIEAGKTYVFTQPSAIPSGTTAQYKLRHKSNSLARFEIKKGTSKSTTSVTTPFPFQYSATTTQVTIKNTGSAPFYLQDISYFTTEVSPLTEVGGVLALGQYPSIGTYDVLNVGYGSPKSTASCFSVTASGFVSCRELVIQENDMSINLTTTDGWEIDALVADASNNLILGRGWWAQNTSGFNTYIEGYQTNIWGRNKIATNMAITQGSDKRLKKDIKDLEDVKDFVMDLKPVEFKYEFASDKDKHLGFIAQDVEKSMNTYGLSSDKYGLITEITGTDNIQYKGLNYTEFIPMCIKMIQEQQQEIDALKEALNEILGN